MNPPGLAGPSNRLVAPRASRRVLLSLGGKRGLGHLVRQAAILRALRRVDPTVELFLQVQAPDHELLGLDLGLGDLVTVDGDGSGRAPLAHAVRRFQPDILMFDTLLPKEAPPRDLAHRPAGILTLRVVRPERLGAILGNPWMDWVRLLLVPHREDELLLEIPRRRGLAMVFTGPIIDERPRDDVQALRRRYGIAPEDVLVVATLGGGGLPGFARRFASSVCIAVQALRPELPELKLILVAGPKNQVVLDLVGDAFEKVASVVPFEPDLPGLYRLARIVIAHGGYNTTNEILRARTPVLFLPCPAKYDDGEARARALVDRGAAYVAEPGDHEAVTRILASYLTDPAEEARKRAACAGIELRPGNDLAAAEIEKLLDRSSEERHLASLPLASALSLTSERTSPPAEEAEEAATRGGRSPFRLPVICWHLVDPRFSDPWSVTPETFAAQLEWLERHARVIGLPRALELFDSGEPAPPDAVVLTFDDGYEGFLAHARSQLLGRGMTATLFLITRYMGELNEWNHRAGYLARHLSWDQARGLLREEFELGVHGRTHQMLVKFERKRIKEELHGAADDIYRELSREPLFAAYPYGSHDRTVVKVARRRFRLTFVAGSKGVSDWREDPHRIRRIVVGPHLSLGQLARHLREYAQG